MSYDEEDDYRPSHAWSLIIDPVSVRYDAQQLATQISSSVAERLSKELLEPVKEMYVEKLDAMISERIGAVLEQAFTQPLFKTDQWGGRKGEALSLPELILDQASKHLSERVDQWGESRHGSSTQTRLQWIFAKALESELGEPLKKEIAAAVQDAKKRATEKVAEILLATATKF